MTEATENNGLAAPDNILSDDAQMEKFQGIATHDGAPIKEEKSTNDAPVKKGSVPAVPAKQDADAEDDGDDGDQGDDGEKGKKHKSAQDRINKAVAKQRAAERTAASLSARLAALEANQNRPKPAPTVEEKEPDPADFEYGELDAKYIKAVARFEARQELTQASKKTQTEQSQAQQTAAQKAAMEEFQTKRSGFMTKGLDIDPDFEEIVSDEGVKISPLLGELLLESEFGPQIAFDMASDPKEAAKVSAMSPARQAAWFGTKETEHSSATPGAEDSEDDPSPDAQSSKVSKAPEPLKGKPRGSGEPQQASADTSDFSAFEAMAMKQD